MLPSHYADPAGNQVAIPDAGALIDLIKSKQINGQTWVLTDEHEDWVNLHTLPEWPQWLAAAEGPPPQPLPDLEIPPVRWPLKVGWPLTLLALATQFGLFYYTRRQMKADDFAEHVGILGFVVGLSWPTGQLIQQKVNSLRKGRKAAIHGLNILITSLAVTTVVTGISLSTWQTYQEKGTAGLAFQDSLRGVEPSIKVWATEMNDEYDAIWAEIDQQAKELGVKGLETGPSAFYSTAQGAHDGERRARVAAEAYHGTAARIRAFVTAYNDRLQRLPISGKLRTDQQKVFDEEFVPGFLADADFMAAKGDSMAAIADLAALCADLIEQGQLTWDGTKVNIKSEVAGAEFDRRYDRIVAKQDEEERLYQIMIKANS